MILEILEATLLPNEEVHEAKLFEGEVDHIPNPGDVISIGISDWYDVINQRHFHFDRDQLVKVTIQVFDAKRGANPFNDGN